MKIQYENEFVQKLEMSDPRTCVYQFIYNENDSVDTKIVQYFIIYRLGLCIKIDSYASHLFYEWSLCHNIEVPISKEKKKYFFSLDKNTNVFSWGAGNSNKNGIQ